VKVLTGREVMQLVPILREGLAAVGVLDVTARALDVSSLLHGYFRLGRRRGAEITFTCQFRSAEWTGNHWRVETTTGALQARVLVNAAGAWADKLAAAAQVAPLPLTPLRRTAILVDVPAGAMVKDWPQVVSPGVQLYFRPDAGKLLVSPMDETAADPCDAQPDDYDVAVCVDRLETLTQLSVQRVSHKWAGLRTFAPDRSPVVGYDPTAHNFFWVAGQGGYGIQTAPALSKLAASIAANYSPGGFAVDRELAAAVSVERLRQSSKLRIDGR
jgi:D-arginine dehydrogenase